MIRLLLLFFSIFFISCISLVLIYGSISIGMLWIVIKLGFFNAQVSFDSEVLQAFCYSILTPAIMFGSIMTGMYCIIVYQAMQKKQHLRIGHLVTIFKSFLLFTAFFCVAYYVFVMMLVSSGKTGMLVVIPYIKVIGRFFDFGLPVIWIGLAWYWIKKYESKFLNEEEEWMLR